MKMGSCLAKIQTTNSDEIPRGIHMHVVSPQKVKMRRWKAAMATSKNTDLHSWWVSISNDCDMISPDISD